MSYLKIIPGLIYLCFIGACGEPGAIKPRVVPKTKEPVVLEPTKDIKKNIREFPHQCSEIQKSYNASSKRNYFFSNIELKNRFKLEKEITSGIGGAKVYFVTDKEDQTKKVLKIFPKDKVKKLPFKRNPTTREMEITCRLDKLDFRNELGESDKVNFFPKFYGFGLTNSDEPFRTVKKPSSNDMYYFLLIELVKGRSMYEEAKVEQPFKDKRKTKKIFYQLLLALEKAYKTLGFVHMDLHPGNIIVTENQPNLFKIIDFGESTIKDFYEDDKMILNKFAHFINPEKIATADARAARDYSLRLFEFDLLLRGKKLTEFIVDHKVAFARFPIELGHYTRKSLKNQNLYRVGDDIQFINMMIFSFRNFYEPQGTFANYCDNLFTCKNQFK